MIKSLTKQIRNSFALLGFFCLSQLFFCSIHAQTVTMKGTVADKDGNPLAGATIQVKGTNNVMAADSLGHFSIAAPKGSAIVVSYTGYLEQTVPVSSLSGAAIKLFPATNDIDEVIVTGYRQQTRGSVIGAVASVGSAQLANIPVDNLSNALGGRLAGVTITQGAGTPGMESSVKIRAQGTFNNISPLYVIDGVVTDKFAFDGLSPNEVNEVTVLKDGASAAIYGSRAANGVILVTTKRGTTGKPVLSYSGIYGFQTPTKLPAVMTAYQQASGINNFLAYNKTPETDARYYTPDELEYFKTHSWNWIDELWKNPQTTQHTLDVRGGSQFVKYFLGGSYNSATGSFNNLDYKKYTLRANVDANITKSLMVSLTMNTDKRTTDGPSWQVTNWRQEDLYKALLIRSPMVPPYINGLPVGNWVEWHPGVVVDPSKAGYNKNEWNEINTTVAINYTVPFVKGLSAKASLNNFQRHIYNKQFNLPYNMTLFNTMGGHNHILGDSAVGLRPRATDEFLQSRYDKIKQYQFNLQLSYKRSFGLHNIDALAVYEQSEGGLTWFNSRIDDFISTVVDQYKAGSTVKKMPYGEETETARLSYVGLLSYNYAQRYLLEGSFRYDGSVVFSPEKRWGFFPSVSAAWRISKERFFRSNLISDLKLRASAALVGNDAVGNFQWLQSDEIVNGAIFNTATRGIEPGVLANPDITWEKSKTYNAGLDAKLWQDKISFKLDVFRRNTYDILGSRQLSIPSTFGGKMPDENYQRVNSSGFEVDLGFDNAFGSGNNTVYFNVHGNFGYATNKVIQTDEAENIRPYKSAIGRPTNGVFGYVAAGILRTQADLDALPAGYTIIGLKPQLGMMNYKDLRGVTSDEPDGKITADDQEYLADYSSPTMNYGFSIGASWRSFSLNMLMQGVGGGKIMMPTVGRDFQGRAEESSFAYWADSWTPDNPNGKYPGYRGASYRTRSDASSFWLVGLDFLRVKNITLNYSLPKRWLLKIHANDIKVFFTGSNLFMLYSANKYYDPEINSINAYPLMKTYSFGLNIGL